MTKHTLPPSLVLVLALVAGCQLVASPNSTPTNQAMTRAQGDPSVVQVQVPAAYRGDAAVAMNFTVPASSYQVLATVSDVAKLQVTLMDGANQVATGTLTQSNLSQGHAAVQFTNLVAGNYTLKLSAYDAQTKDIGDASANASVTPGKMTQLNANLKLIAASAPPGAPVGELQANISITAGDPAPTPTPPPPVGVTILPTPGATDTSSPSPSATPSSTDASLKPELVGLLDRDSSPPPDYQNAVQGYVVEVNWSELQPQQGGDIALGNKIDQAISYAHAHGLRLKVRVYCGANAPEWAKEIGGAPFSLSDPQSPKNPPPVYTCGRWWEPDYMAAYNELQAKLAAKYDNTPEIAQVTVSGACSIYAETMIRQVTDSDTRAKLIAAGYTEAKDQAAIKNEIDAHAVWKHTGIEMAFNPYQYIDASGAGHEDVNYTIQMMNYGRQKYGHQFVLANNSLRSPDGKSDGDLGAVYAQMYQAMENLGAPISFQTATGDRIAQSNGTLATTLSYAAYLKGNSVELPSGYGGSGNVAMTPADLLTYLSKLQANPQ